MHGISPQQFAETVSAFLVPFYIALAVMNGIAAYYLWQKTQPVTYFKLNLGSVQPAITNAMVWAFVACVFVILAAMCAGANLALMPRMPMAFRTTVNEHTGPVIYTRGHDDVAGRSVRLPHVGSCSRSVAWTIWNLMLLFLGLSMPDPNFFAIVAKPDNVPIVALVFLLAFFTWLATYQGGGERRAQRRRACRRWRSWTTRRCSSGRTWSTPN